MVRGNLFYVFQNLTAGTYNTPDIDANVGDDYAVEVLIHSVNGAPTTASLTAKIQVAPILLNGGPSNIAAETNAITRTWQDVVAGDGYLGHALLDGAFPTSLADQTIGATANRVVHRRFRPPMLGQIFRVSLTAAFTGGTSPSFSVTVGASPLVQGMTYR